LQEPAGAKLQGITAPVWYINSSRLDQPGPCARSAARWVTATWEPARAGSALRQQRVASCRQLAVARTSRQAAGAALGLRIFEHIACGRASHAAAAPIAHADRPSRQTCAAVARQPWITRRWGFKHFEAASHPHLPAAGVHGPPLHDGWLSQCTTWCVWGVQGQVVSWNKQGSSTSCVLALHLGDEHAVAWLPWRDMQWPQVRRSSGGRLEEAMQLQELALFETVSASAADKSSSDLHSCRGAQQQRQISCVCYALAHPDMRFCHFLCSIDASI
jgi:hypothetical protein